MTGVFIKRGNLETDGRNREDERTQGEDSVYRPRTEAWDRPCHTLISDFRLRENELVVQGPRTLTQMSRVSLVLFS